LKVTNIKYWYDGNLEQAIFRHHGGYKTYLENTAKKITEDALFFVADENGDDIITEL